MTEPPVPPEATARGVAMGRPRRASSQEAKKESASK